MRSHSNHIIHRMEMRRIFRQMLHVIEPHDWPIIALRLEGLREFQIASLLGISRQTLNNRDRQLKSRIQKHVPEAWQLIRDLHRPTGYSPTTAPLERGWISDDFGAPEPPGDRAAQPQTADITPPPPEKSHDRGKALQEADPPHTKPETSAHRTQHRRH